MTKTIVVCLPGNNFSNNFLLSWTTFLADCLTKNYKIIVSNKYTSNVYFVRSLCLEANVLRGTDQKPFAGKLDYDYILWLDNDIVFKSEQLFSMIETLDKNPDMHILSGLYAMDGGSKFPCVKDLDTEYFKKHGSFEFISTKEDLGSELFTLDYAGMGLMLVRKGVFEAISYPWFKPRTFTFDHDDVHIEDFCSEDVAFCLNAKDKGFKVYLDPKIRVGHEKRFIY